MGRSLEVTDRRMAAAVKRVLAEPFLAGTPSLVRDVMEDRRRHRGSFAQRGASALGFALGAELGLQLCVRTDRQAAPWAAPGCGTLRAGWTPIAGAGGELGVLAWDHRDGLAPRTRDLAGSEVAGEGVLRKAWPALRPGAGHAGDARRGPWRQTWTGPVPQVDRPLQQPWRLCQRLDQPRHRGMRRLGRWADHDRAWDLPSPVQPAVRRQTVARFGAALPAVAHVRLRPGEAPSRGP